MTSFLNDLVRDGMCQSNNILRPVSKVITTFKVLTFTLKVKLPLNYSFISNLALILFTNLLNEFRDTVN